MNKFGLLITGLILTGCSEYMAPYTNSSYEDPAESYHATKCGLDKFTKTLSCWGGTITAGLNSRGNIQGYLTANSTQDKDLKLRPTEVSFIARTSTPSNSRMHIFNSAYDSDGENLKFTRLNWDVQGGTYNSGIEIDEITMPVAYWRNKSLDREFLEIQLRGKDGSFIIKIPASYIAGYLDYLEDQAKE
jgi:hypothetical protein